MMGCCGDTSAVVQTHAMPAPSRKRITTTGDKTLENMVDDLSHSVDHDIEEIRFSDDQLLYDDSDVLTVDDSLTKRYRDRHEPQTGSGLKGDDISELTFITKRVAAASPPSIKYDLGGPSPDTVRYDLGASLSKMRGEGDEKKGVIVGMRASLKRIIQRDEFSA